jgi:hypothetical protein
LRRADWIATERAKRELTEMSDRERAAAPIQVEPQEIADATVRFIRDEHRRGVEQDGHRFSRSLSHPVGFVCLSL